MLFRSLGQVIFGVESALDDLARAVGLSAAEIRRRNAVRPGDDFVVNGAPDDDLVLTEAGNGLPQCLELVEAALADGTGEPAPEGWLVGSGLAAAMIATIPPRGHHATATVTAFADGSVEVGVGSAEFGNGSATVHTQLVASELSDLGWGGAIALRSATRIPNASNESGLGLDTFDFYSTALIAKTIQSVRVVGNIGLGILADPTRGDRQNDVLMYGLSFARAINTAAEVVGEINGRKDTRNGEPPPGTESRGTARFGARYTVGPLRADAALSFGITSNDPGFGVTAGFTYVFQAFRNP